MPKLRVYPAAAPRRPRRVRRPRRGTVVATPWAPDASGRPRIRLTRRPWIPQYVDDGGVRYLAGWYCPTFGCDWFFPTEDHELD